MKTQILNNIILPVLTARGEFNLSSLSAAVKACNKQLNLNIKIPLHKLADTTLDQLASLVTQHVMTATVDNMLRGKNPKKCKIAVIHYPDPRQREGCAHAPDDEVNELEAEALAMHLILRERGCTVHYVDWDPLDYFAYLSYRPDTPAERSAWAAQKLHTTHP